MIFLINCQLLLVFNIMQEIPKSPTIVKPSENFFSKLIGYFVKRKKKFGILAGIAFVLYVGQKTGYTEKLFSYSLKYRKES